MRKFSQYCWATELRRTKHLQYTKPEQAGDFDLSLSSWLAKLARILACLRGKYGDALIDRSSEALEAIAFNRKSCCTRKCEDKAADKKTNLTDTDARFMKNCGKIMPSYNVQVASSEGFILAADIANNNAENDQHELPAILESVKKNTGKPIHCVRCPFRRLQKPSIRKNSGNNMGIEGIWQKLALKARK